jgi:deazaflavin-dependent oxidoreductase (nitroreductase family)
MLLLLHRGRMSGAERFVVVEAVDRENPDTVLIASGFGTASQWYQNLKADPSCLVPIGFRNRVPCYGRAPRRVSGCGTRPPASNSGS